MTFFIRLLGSAQDAREHALELFVAEGLSDHGSEELRLAEVFHVAGHQDDREPGRDLPDPLGELKPFFLGRK